MSIRDKELVEAWALLGPTPGGYASQNFNTFIQGFNTLINDIPEEIGTELPPAEGAFASGEEIWTEIFDVDIIKKRFTPKELLDSIEKNIETDKSICCICDDENALYDKYYSREVLPIDFKYKLLQDEFDIHKKHREIWDKRNKEKIDRLTEENIRYLERDERLTLVEKWLHNNSRDINFKCGKELYDIINSLV